MTPKYKPVVAVHSIHHPCSSCRESVTGKRSAARKVDYELEEVARKDEAT